MKKLFSAIAVVLFAAVTLVSCAKTDVDKVVDIFNQTAEKINALEQGDFDAIQTINEEAEAELAQYKESAQELTEADCKALAGAFFDMTMASYHAAFGAPAPSTEEKTKAIDQIAPELSKYKTLGEFISAAM